jgi:NTP pyrophosphatase (non-canonical NTP hydrolase)
MTPSRDISRLIEIMAALRNPDTGCPWDLKQDFSTIAPYTIEEAYEVADAIARGDLSELREELGDLLLQVVYHARMAQEQGAFRPIWKPCCGKPMPNSSGALHRSSAPSPGAAHRRRIRRWPKWMSCGTPRRRKNSRYSRVVRTYRRSERPPPDLIALPAKALFAVRLRCQVVFTKILEPAGHALLKVGRL